MLLWATNLESLLPAAEIPFLPAPLLAGVFFALAGPLLTDFDAAALAVNVVEKSRFEFCIWVYGKRKKAKGMSTTRKRSKDEKENHLDQLEIVQVDKKRAKVEDEIKDKDFKHDDDKLWASLDAIPSDWRRELVEKESKKSYWKSLLKKVEADDGKSIPVYPQPNYRFSFMDLPLQDIKVVIIGQDPYHGPHQAHGLAFSVQKGIKTPPSLVNIYKEIWTDLGLDKSTIPNHGYLKAWQDQGVLLLNATLTVLKSTPNSHAKYGWQDFTDEIIRYLGSSASSSSQHLVFMLWGKFAQSKEKWINRNKHLVLKAAHPSPLGANKGGWWGCKHFSKANAFLEKKGKTAIDWTGALVDLCTNEEEKE